MNFLENVVKDLVKHGLGTVNAGVRENQNLPTTVKPGGARGGKVIYTKKENRPVPLPKKFAGPAPTRGQLDKVKSSGRVRKPAPKIPSRDEFVAGKRNKWLDDRQSGFWGHLIHDKPRQSQIDAFEDQWGTEYDKRYGGEDRTLGEKGLGFWLGQDLDSDEADKSNLAIALAATLFGPKAVSMGAQGAKTAGGKASDSIMRTLAGAQDEVRAGRAASKYNKIDHLPQNAPLSGRGLRGLGPSPYQTQATRREFDDLSRNVTGFGEQMSLEDMLPASAWW